jgi:hypothetical protein
MMPNLAILYHDNKIWMGKSLLTKLIFPFFNVPKGILFFDFYNSSVTKRKVALFVAMECDARTAESPTRAIFIRA